MPLPFRFLMARATATTLFALIGLVLQAQGGFNARIQVLERTLDSYYRGERLEAAVARSTREVDAYNTYAKKRQAEIERERLRLEEAVGAGKGDRSRLEEMDKDLKNPPPGIDQDEIRRKVEARNALVQKLNEQAMKTRKLVDAYNAYAQHTLKEIESERKRVLAVQAKVDARLAAFEAFTKANQDTAFFADLNRLLAEIRQAQRAVPADPSLDLVLAKVRSLRLELADWAKAGQALRPNGLVIVDVRVGDEPCWFVLDTGAMDTIVSPQIAEAVGCGKSLGKETSLSVIGGLRVTGNAFRIPRLEVGGQIVENVAASAVLPFDVGIDGLLGQSFLKYFVYTIDERRGEKLLLTPR